MMVWSYNRPPRATYDPTVKFQQLPRHCHMITFCVTHIYGHLQHPIITRLQFMMFFVKTGVFLRFSAKSPHSKQWVHLSTKCSIYDCFVHLMTTAKLFVTSDRSCWWSTLWLPQLTTIMGAFHYSHKIWTTYIIVLMYLKFPVSVIVFIYNKMSLCIR